MNLLITGANRGLGLALSAEAVKRGHTVFAGVRNPEQGMEGLRQLSIDHPGQISVLQLDVGSERSCRGAANKLVAENTALEAIINNAAILEERSKPIEELDMEKVEHSFNINLFGPMRVVKCFLPMLVKGPDASIINISSEAGSFQNAYGGDYPYALSKSSLNMFSQQLRNYLAKDQVAVFAIHPGWIKTDMGGERSPGTPEDSAAGILDLIERKTVSDGESTFINIKGEAMPL